MSSLGGNFTENKILTAEQGHGHSSGAVFDSSVDLFAFCLFTLELAPGLLVGDVFSLELLQNTERSQLLPVELMVLFGEFLEMLES